ncbi:hypothetical protein ACLOJK_001799 [Asimina triloba]
MDASLRLFASTSHLDRRLPISIKTTFQHRYLPISIKTTFQDRHLLKHSNPNLSSPSSCLYASRYSNALPSLLSLPLPLSGIFSSPPPHSNFNPFVPSAFVAKQEPCLSRNRPAEGDAGGGRLSFGTDRGGDLTVVLLGWLGAEKRHLKRYAELYTARGIRTVEFVVPLKVLLGLDLGRQAEARVVAFAGELIEWLSETEKNGLERGLVFHTFSNTGWLA